MTKADLIRQISNDTNYNAKDVSIIIESLMETIKNTLSNGDNVYLRGFGSFEIKRRAQKTARNIRKNTQIIIPEHNIPIFKPGKCFIQKIKKSN